MLRNYLKIAWRNLLKSKIFSFINIVGLSIGLTCCMLISIYIYNELNFDSYHQHIERLFQLGTTFVKDGKDFRTSNTPAPMAEAMKLEFPEIDDVARIMPLFNEDKTLFQYKQGAGNPKSFYEKRGFMADASFFKLFNYQFIEGNPGTALAKPNCIVINEEMAKKNFGNAPALNQILHLSSSTNGEGDYKVTGVFRPIDKPSQIDARFFISIAGGNMEQFIRQQVDMVSNNMFSTFFLLKPGANPKLLESKFPAFVDKHMGKQLAAAGFYKKQFLIPVRDMHLRAGMNEDITPVGSISYLYILGSIAAFTLLIACINFMNLSTARSSKRSAEVGVRKVLGAERKSLVVQFIGESILMSTLAFVLALAATKILLPAFSQVSGRFLELNFSSQWPIIACFFLMAMLTGIIAGSYPAFYLSSFQPVKVLKGRFSNSLSAVALRKGLVIFQFIISVALIIGSVVIAQQMSYMRSADLGFAKDQQIIIPLRSTGSKNTYLSLKNELKTLPQVREAGASKVYPGIANVNDLGLRKAGQTANEAKLVRTNYVDNSFIQTLDIQPVAGRLFSPQFPADTNGSVVLNEKAVSEIGFPNAQDALGKKVFFDFRQQVIEYTVIGVVKDFHWQDLHVAITPYAFYLNNNNYYSYLVVHANTADMTSLLKSVEQKWNKFNPGEPFEYSFLDADFQKNYEAENKFSSLVGYFTLVAILISCLGLFGLATFSAEQRTKEIGVRKVLGASVINIAGLLSRDFLKLVLVAIVIASPIAWYAMKKWLMDFEYRVSIGWAVFAITTASAVLIALITVSFQALKAALANPVKSLRTE